MKKFEGDAQNTPLSEILKALGYSYRDARTWNPRCGRKEIYPAELDKGDIIFPEQVLFVGTASETHDWLVENGQLDGEKELSYNATEEFEDDRARVLGTAS